ncbi:DUF742 domain-containing protein [Streptomyces sp. XM4193]|uniref:DUF742 domain-containing protein n=1 Tax=Streptomyces sp. XM4193 TaxID=2929782 RepID=UPI001FF91FAF|nr:DUF742 domain-containing protein [Streptomyces sp. XM4193]MCK1798788.1 DUF742 domain-containing protein [Streptomyces sp. XM4193]
MTTPPGGPFGSAQQPQSDPQYQRFNFPSTPSHQQQATPPPRQRQEPPRGRQSYQGGSAGPTGQDGRFGQNNQNGQGGRPAQSGGSSSGGQSPLVRPYAMTGGRTRPRYQLAIEALVHTTADAMQLQGQLPEHQRICRLCYEIKSVAEISALLSIPLGVARILVADLAEAGLVAIHQPGGDESAGGQPDVTLLERVLSGLRKL